MHEFREEDKISRIQESPAIFYYYNSATKEKW